MKAIFCFAVIVLTAASARAQYKAPQPTYTYKQKLEKQRLQSLFPQLAQQNDTGAYQPNMPVVPLQSRGALTGETPLGKLYNMQPDNMPAVKPNPTNAATPNAFTGKVFMVPDTKKP